jgi:hypothetical protein
MPTRHSGSSAIGCDSGVDRRLAERWRWWAVGAAAAILIAAVAFYVLVASGIVSGWRRRPYPTPAA